MTVPLCLPRRAFLAAFGDVQLALRSQLHRIRKLPRLRRLREEVAEHLIAVAFLVAIRVHQLPDAVAVEDEQDFESIPRDTMLIGSCSPLAKRFHVTFSKSPFRPEISHTSPSKVTPAASP
jgi:hypothetical protein